jgi:hypothetical protein
MPKEIRGGASYTDDMWRRANAALAHARRAEAASGWTTTTPRGASGRAALPQPSGGALFQAASVRARETAGSD